MSRTRCKKMVVALLALVMLAGLISRVDAQNAAAAMAPTATLALDQAIETAVEGNPSLAEMRARAHAAAAIPSQVGTLPDPTISFNALNLPVDTFDLSQEPMTQLQLAVSQAFPFPGKLSLKEKAAEFDAAALENGVEETRLQLVRDVRATWWQTFYLDRALGIIDRNLDLLKEFVAIAQTKYTVGEGLQQDVLLAQVERSQLMDRRIQLVAARRGQAATLNALLDRQAGLPVRLPDKVDTTLPETLPEETLFRIADEARPLLAKFENELRAADARVDLAERERLPDFKLGAGYGFRSGDNPNGTSRADVLSLRLSMNIPLYAGRKQARAIDQRSSERLMRKYALQNERGKVHAAIATAQADYEQSREQSVLYATGIIPQARQTVASMLAGYQVNKVDFLNLVRSQITLYNYEMLYWRALSEARRSLARLSASVGSEATDE